MKIVSYVFAVIMILSAIAHVASPAMYEPMIPDFIPANVANILAFIGEGVVGVLLLLPKYRKLGGLGFALLMITFLPVHFLDAMKDAPFVGSKTVAYIRIVAQFVLMYLGWKIYKSNK